MWMWNRYISQTQTVPSTYTSCAAYLLKSSRLYKSGNYIKFSVSVRITLFLRCMSRLVIFGLEFTSSSGHWTRVDLRRGQNCINMWVGWLIKNNDLKRNSIMSRSTFPYLNMPRMAERIHIPPSLVTHSYSAEANPTNRKLLWTRRESQGHNVKSKGCTAQQRDWRCC